MKALFNTKLAILIVGAFAFVLVGIGATRALACSPEGYVEELRVDGELPGGG